MATPGLRPGLIEGLLMVDGGEAPEKLGLHSFRSREGYTDGHLRFHGEAVVAQINGRIGPVPYWQ